MKVGDIVRLKSGGPDMTIGNITDEFAYCQWFNKENDAKDGSYRLDALDLKPHRAPGQTRAL